MISYRSVSKWGRNARTHDFEEIALFNKPALYTSIRIDTNTIPHGYHYYEIGEIEGSSGDCFYIGKRIAANHWGTIITNERIKLDKDGLRSMTDEDIDYGVSEHMSLKAFTERYPPVMENIEKAR